jgi:glycosyltransferase involved in cell wall biosynthesis
VKEVLFISYYFPPMGGAGVQRSAKFVKYLPDFGWRPIVLTARAGDYHVQREFRLDESLLKEADCEVHRVRDPEPRRLRAALETLRIFRLVWGLLYFLFWEREFFWAVAAARHALRLARQRRPAVIYTSSAPYSLILVGYWLRRNTGIPWVADLRDLWTQDPLWRWPSRLHYALTKSLEKKLLRHADAVIANTPLAAERLRALLGPGRADRVVAVPNGYDADDLAPEPSGVRADGRLTITHVGTFHDRPREDGEARGMVSWLREGYSPAPLDPWMRTPRTLFEGLRVLFDRRPDLRDKVRVVLIGHLHDGWRRMISELGLERNVEVTGYLPHDKAVARMRETDALYCVQIGFRDGRPVPYVPAKLYEYMATGKPILAPVADGDTRRVLERSGVGVVTGPRDSEAVADVLLRLYEQRQANAPTQGPDWEYIRGFERRRLTEKLAELFESVGAGRREAT